MNIVLFRIVKPSAYRECRVDFLCVYIRDHVIVALVTAVIHFQVLDSQLLDYLRCHVLNNTGRISLFIGITVRHVVFQISDTQFRMLIQPCFL